MMNKKYIDLELIKFDIIGINDYNFELIKIQNQYSHIWIIIPLVVLFFIIQMTTLIDHLNKNISVY